MFVRNWSRIVVAALFLVGAASIHADAAEIVETYYTGCDTLTEVGQWARDCQSHTSTSGTLAGDWRAIESTSCLTFDTTTTYWEHCGTTWVQRTTLGACQCSH
jgi:hypothetical protein